MPRPTRPGWIIVGGFAGMLIALLVSIAAYRLPFGSLVDWGYFIVWVILVFLYGQAAATATYYDFQEGPEAADCKTEAELDSEGRRLASIAFEKGAKEGLLAAGIPSFVVWVVVRLLF